MKFSIPWLLSLLLTVGHTAGQECNADGTCDKHERCTVWKEEGECYRNKSYMDEVCPVSCSEGGYTHKRNKGDPLICEDYHIRCPAWASLGECDENFDMRRYCPKSCGTCAQDPKLQRELQQKKKASVEDTDPLCVDKHEQCEFWASVDECTKNPNYMANNCRKSCGACNKRTQTVPDGQANEILVQTKAFGLQQRAEGASAEATIDKIKDTMRYLESDDYLQLSPKIRSNCMNRNDLCSFWAHLGECEANKAFMKTNCGPACLSCHLIDFDTRCPKLDNVVPALAPGDLNEMFERIVATAPGNRTLTAEERQELVDSNMTEYSVVVLSRPGESQSTDISVAQDKSLPPWVVMFENFLTPEECAKMIALGHEEGYKRSEDVGAEKFDGSREGLKNSGRTSENAWCASRNECRQKEVPQRLHDRMSQVLGIPPGNSEDLQLLRYEIGQFYQAHHDYIPYQRDRQCGPRILTFFMYLTDVEAGGGTDFPDLGITVMPKKGRALLWPSVLNSSPLDEDSRTRHQALPVEEGTKFAANGWIHMYDYLGPQSRGCN